MIALESFRPGQLGGERRRICGARRCAKGKKLQKVTKEVIEIHVLLAPLAFACDIAYVHSARFSSEIDFCSLAVRMAAENVASTSVSFAPVAARNSPRKRCSSAHQARSPDLSKTASASFIASIASEVLSARMF
jgi:hypothetical protein